MYFDHPTINPVVSLVHQSISNHQHNSSIHVSGIIRPSCLSHQPSRSTSFKSIKSRPSAQQVPNHQPSSGTHSYVSSIQVHLLHIHIQVDDHLTIYTSAQTTSRPSTTQSHQLYMYLTTQQPAKLYMQSKSTSYSIHLCSQYTVPPEHSTIKTSRAESLNH